MVGKSILFVLQLLLFLILFALGSVLLPLFPAIPVWQVQTGPARAFVYDGVVFAALAWLLLLGAQAARKHLRAAGAVTTAAFALALLLGLLLHFGFKSV